VTLSAPSDFPAGLALAPVLDTKVTPPILPAVHVPRPGLCRAVADGARVVSVVAPAGYGKTVLVGEWLQLEATTEEVAWYSLDALDANPLCFWRHVVAAISTVRHVGDELLGILLDRGPMDVGFLHLLLDAMLASERPLVLVLDDLHVLRDRPTLDALALLVERAGAQFRLVFTARFDPALPLARWRSRGLLTEIRQDDLRFDTGAAVALLDAYDCATLGDDDVRRLVDGTEGWVTGLQLAALASPQRVVDALVDAHSGGTMIAGYLVGEVLDRLPDPVREFAFAISVLPEFDVDSAAWLTGRPDAAEMIGMLERGNVFVVRLGVVDGHYRFHHLFRELLLAEFRSRDRSAWYDAHLRAAELLARQGRPDAVVDVLTGVGDVGRAFDLVIRPALLLSDHGWSREFRQWLDQLPIGPDLSAPDQMLDLAFAHFLGGRLDAARQWTDHAAELVPAGDMRVAARRLAIAVAEGDVAAGERAVSSVGAAPSSSADRFESRFELTAARLHLLRGDLDAASAAIDRAVVPEHAEVVGSVTVPALQARVSTMRGDPLVAAEQARVSLEAARRLGIRANPAVLEAAIAATVAALQADRLADASVVLDQLLDIVDAVDYPYSRAHAAALLVRWNGQRHGWAVTAGMLEELCARAGWRPGDALSWLVEPYWVRALAAAGRVAEASHLAATVPTSASRHVAEAEVALARRRYDDVVSLLAQRHAWQLPQAVDAAVLVSLSLTGADAERELSDAIRRCAGSGLIAPFRQRGDDLDRLLRRLPAQLTDPIRPAGSVAPSAVTSADVLVEPLSPRESELLTLLPTHLSNSGLAARMYVSINTVKTMLRSIYRKLGSASRDETVTIARRLGLLPPE
jgi:LuxR family transcriptional regulator, maltose regulon positive regulatory protein